MQLESVNQQKLTTKLATNLCIGAVEVVLVYHHYEEKKRLPTELIDHGMSYSYII